MQISGTLQFPSRGQPLDIAIVRVTLRDITEFDGPARTVAQLDLPAVHVPASGLDLPFELDVELSNLARTYALRAHADTDGSGSVTAGDLVTTSVHAVRPTGTQRVVLPLHSVTG